MFHFGSKHRLQSLEALVRCPLPFQNGRRTDSTGYVEGGGRYWLYCPDEPPLGRLCIASLNRRSAHAATASGIGGFTHKSRSDRAWRRINYSVVTRWRAVARRRLAEKPYRPYSLSMKPLRKGAEEARNQLPELLTAAQRGQLTIITRHGKPVAVLMPPSAIPNGRQQLSLLPLEGTGRGLYGTDSRETLRQLKDEWDR